MNLRALRARKFIQPRKFYSLIAPDYEVETATETSNPLSSTRSDPSPSYL